MDEETLRRIVREEIERSQPLTHYRGIPLPPNAPVVDFRPDWRYPGGVAGVPGATSAGSEVWGG